MYMAGPEDRIASAIHIINPVVSSDFSKYTSNQTAQIIPEKINSERQLFDMGRYITSAPILISLPPQSNTPAVPQPQHRVPIHVR
jgi:hypothetical protein